MLDKEFEVFTDKLNQVQEKFLKQKFPEFRDFNNQLVKNYQDYIMKSKDDMQNLQKETTKIKEKFIENKESMVLKTEYLEIMGNTLNSIKSNVDGKLKQKQELENDLSFLTELSNKSREVIDNQKKTSEQQFKDVEKSLQFFKERLGLQFKKLSGNRLQFVFYSIDSEEPDRPFYFIFHINDNIYIIDECEPAIENLKEMSDKLNETNNFSAFITNLRKKFRFLCNKENVHM